MVARTDEAAGNEKRPRCLLRKSENSALLGNWKTKIYGLEVVNKIDQVRTLKLISWGSDYL